jgi:hypothetical protein
MGDEKDRKTGKSAPERHAGNRPASTVGTHTKGTDPGHRDMPEAAERKKRRDEPKEEKR